MSVPTASALPGWRMPAVGGRPGCRGDWATAMPARLRLPRPQIATKLYGAIALFLAVVYVLAAIAIHFAGRTEETSARLRAGGLATVEMVTRIEQLLRHQQRGWWRARLPPPIAARWRPTSVPTEELTADIAALVPRAQGADDKLALRFDAIASAGQAAIERRSWASGRRRSPPHRPTPRPWRGWSAASRRSAWAVSMKCEETLTRLRRKLAHAHHLGCAGAAMTGC